MVTGAQWDHLDNPVFQAVMAAMVFQESGVHLDLKDWPELPVKLEVKVHQVIKATWDRRVTRAMTVGMDQREPAVLWDLKVRKDLSVL